MCLWLRLDYVAYENSCVQTVMGSKTHADRMCWNGLGLKSAENSEGRGHSEHGLSLPLEAS